MTDFHSKTFYGNKTSIQITSPSKDVPCISLSCFNRKEDGSWEKIQDGEGRTVKLSIEEIICILEVLNKRSAIWRGYHIFKDVRTQVQVGWQDESREVLIIQLGSYKKKLRFPNVNFLKMLLDHLLIEKIEFATSLTAKSKEKGKIFQEFEEYSLFTENITSRDGLRVVETTEYSPISEVMEISAKIKAESPKALLISFDDQEFWVPKSTIHSGYDANDKKTVQKFIIDQWIIERNRKIDFKS